MSTGTQRRQAIIDQVTSCVCKDRQNTYGDAEDNFANIAKFWNAWLIQRGILQESASDCVRSHDVAVMSALIKIARLSTSPDHIDNWVDLAGYAVCGGGIRVAQKQASDARDIVLTSTSANGAEAYYNKLEREFKAGKRPFEPSEFPENAGETVQRDVAENITSGSKWKRSSDNAVATVDHISFGLVFHSRNGGPCCGDVTVDEFLRTFEPVPQAADIKAGSLWWDKDTPPVRIVVNKVCADHVVYSTAPLVHSTPVRVTNEIPPVWMISIEGFLDRYEPCTT